MEFDVNILEYGNREVVSKHFLRNTVPFFLFKVTLCYYYYAKMNIQHFFG